MEYMELIARAHWCIALFVVIIITIIIIYCCCCDRVQMTGVVSGSPVF